MNGEVFKRLTLPPPRVAAFDDVNLSSRVLTRNGTRLRTNSNERP